MPRIVLLPCLGITLNRMRFYIRFSNCNKTYKIWALILHNPTIRIILKMFYHHPAVNLIDVKLKSILYIVTYLNLTTVTHHSLQNLHL